jgi:hypothetical protein
MKELDWCRTSSSPSVVSNDLKQVKMRYMATMSVNGRCLVRKETPDFAGVYVTVCIPMNPTSVPANPIKIL